MFNPNKRIVLCCVIGAMIGIFAFALLINLP